MARKAIIKESAKPKPNKASSKRVAGHYGKTSY